MLSRTADHLFWMARYTERAENTARMLDVNYQTSLLPQSAEVAEQGWWAMLDISELTQAYDHKYGLLHRDDVIDFMPLGEDPYALVLGLKLNVAGTMANGTPSDFVERP